MQRGKISYFEITVLENDKQSPLFKQTKPQNSTTYHTLGITKGKL